MIRDKWKEKTYQKRLKSMTVAKASCPASLSFIFKVCPHQDLAKMGSIGVGCTIDREVEVEVEKAASDEVLFNGSTINLPTVNSVVSRLALSPTKISIKSPLPLGYGFGISGAASLACAYALNRLFNLRKNKLELAKIAHVAEIENHTGLGSVGTQISGGFLVKKSPGLPVDAYKLPFVGGKLYAVIIDKLETPTILKSQSALAKVNYAADLALAKIRKTKNITLAEIIDISYTFAKEAELLTNGKVAAAIKEIHKLGAPATISMLGYVVLTTKKLEGISGYPIKELIITDKTAYS